MYVLACILSAQFLLSVCLYLYLAIIFGALGGGMDILCKA